MLTEFELSVRIDLALDKPKNAQCTFSRAFSFGQIHMKTGTIVEAIFAGIAAVTLLGGGTLLIGGTAWASKELNEQYLGKCVDLGNGATGRVAKVSPWNDRHGGPSVSFRDWTPIATGKVLVNTGGNIYGSYEASTLKVVACK